MLDSPRSQSNYPRALKTRDEPPAGLSNLREAVRYISGLDRTIHESSRLAALTIFVRHGPTEYREMSQVTGLSRANLSNHLGKLKKTGLVSSTKTDRKTNTGMTLRLTKKGRQRLEDYYAQMMRIESSQNGPPGQTPEPPNHPKTDRGGYT